MEAELKELEKTKKRANKAGRPTKLTPEVVTKLVAAFNMGYNDSEAAAYAGVSRKTLYEWKCEHPEFRYKINRAKLEPTTKAKEVVINSGNLNAAKWWLERKAAYEFSSTPQEVSPIPPELQDFIGNIEGIITITEQRIGIKYRDKLYAIREQERVSHTNNPRNKDKVSYKDAILTRILELPENQLADHITQEIVSTGRDIGGVRQLIEERQEYHSILRKEMDMIKHWNDEE